jgi:hypothetical protein
VPGQETGKQDINVLFIGNSYTGVHNLPELVAQMAEAKNKSFRYTKHVPGGRTFERHWQEGKAVSLIRQGGWDAVVLQDQSFEPVIDPDNMFRFARKLCEEIDRVGARKVFFLTWAYEGERGWMRKIEDPVFKARVLSLLPVMQDKLDESYIRIAGEVKGEVAPVGPAWRKALAANSDRRLHKPDRSHPSELGAYLSALVFYATLFKEQPEGMPAELFPYRSSGDEKKRRQSIRVSDPDRKEFESIAWQAFLHTTGRE